MQRRRKTLQFGIGLGIIILMIGWLAYSGIQESKTYYVTVGELQSKADAHQRRYRGGGNVAAGTIHKSSGRTEFTLEQDGKTVPVVYTGKDPLPDTLQDGAQAMADGHYLNDGTFHAETVQAKCASKYEAGAMRPNTAPVKN